MRRVCQHFERLDGIRFQRAMENEESRECKVTFDFLPVKLVNLRKVFRPRKNVCRSELPCQWTSNPTPLYREQARDFPVLYTI